MVSNEELLIEIIDCKRTSSRQLRKMFVELVDTILTKYKQYYGGEYPDYVNVSEMRDYMLMHIAEHWKIFKPARSNRPISYFTQCLTGCVLWFVAHKKYEKFPTESSKISSYNRAMSIIK